MFKQIGTARYVYLISIIQGNYSKNYVEDLAYKEHHEGSKYVLSMT